MMRFLITGHAGFVGRNIINLLTQNSDNFIIGIDKKECSYNKENVKSFQGNILDKKIMDSITTKVDCVIHLAAEHQDFGVSAADYFKVNEEGTRILTKAATKNGIKKILFFSSVAVYGSNTTPSTEETIINPNSLYGKSKYAAEKVLEKWFNSDEENTVIILRPAVIYGEGMNDYANIYRLVNTIKRNKFMFVGNKQIIKSMAYVKNIAAVTNYLHNNINSGYNVFNYADSPHLNGNDTAKHIYKSFNIPLPKFVLPYNLTLFLAKAIDIIGKITGKNFPITAARIKKFNTATPHTADKIIQFGFKAKYDNIQGLKNTCEYYIDK